MNYASCNTVIFRKYNNILNTIYSKIASKWADPGHWEKKCWITMYNKKFLLPTDYGTNDETTLKMGAKQPSPMNSALRNQNV